MQINYNTFFSPLHRGIQSNLENFLDLGFHVNKTNLLFIVSPLHCFSLELENESTK